MSNTWRLLKRRQSWSTELADTMTVWLVLFLRLQARTSWERETLSLSAICENEIIRNIPLSLSLSLSPRLSGRCRLRCLTVSVSVQSCKVLKFRQIFCKTLVSKSMNVESLSSLGRYSKTLLNIFII